MPKRPEPKRKVVRKSKPPAPLADAASARRQVNGLKTLYKDPAQRVDAITKLLNRAAREKSSQAVIALIEDARMREINAVAGQVSIKGFNFRQSYEGKHLRFMDQRIWNSIRLGAFPSVGGLILSLVAFARKRGAHEYVADYMVNGVAMKLRVPIFRGEKRVSHGAKDLLVDALDHAIALYREAGKETKADRLHSFLLAVERKL